MLVDWLKHAFITKFNHIRPSVYERYIDVLCRDLASSTMSGKGGRKGRKVREVLVKAILLTCVQHAYVDQSPLVARRLGFASLPLAILFLLIGSQSVSLLFSYDSMSLSSKDELNLSSRSPSEDIMHYVKWCAMGVLFWLWCVMTLPFDSSV
jgi:hypothetical protein